AGGLSSLLDGTALGSSLDPAASRTASGGGDRGTANLPEASGFSLLSAASEAGPTLDSVLAPPFTQGPDHFFGGIGADYTSALSGADTLFGNSGADTLGAASGNDTLYGGTANDTL